MLEIKVCAKCGEEKPVGDFTKAVNRPDGRYPYCKKCRQEAYESNKDTLLRKMRVYRESNPELTLLQHAKKRAREKGIECSLTLQDITIPKVCPVLGIPLFIGTGKFGPNSPSLDRKDPEKGYVPGNVLVMSFRANLLKNNASVEELEKVVSWLRGSCGFADRSS